MHQSHGRQLMALTWKSMWKLVGGGDGVGFARSGRLICNTPAEARGRTDPARPAQGSLISQVFTPCKLPAQTWLLTSSGSDCCVTMGEGLIIVGIGGLSASPWMLAPKRLKLPVPTIRARRSTGPAPGIFFPGPVFELSGLRLFQIIHYRYR